MKLIAIAFWLLITQGSWGQDCVTLAQNKPGTLTRLADAFLNQDNRKPAPGDMAKMNPYLGKAEGWIKNLLRGFTGAKVGYTNEYSLDYVNDGWANDFYKATGLKGYYGATTRFWAYYCYNNSNTIHTESEAGSFIYVNFNNVLASHNLTQDVGVFTVNGKFAFMVLEKSHSEGNVDFYDLRKRMDFNDTIYTSKNDIIIIRNSNKPVFIPITRKEYLQQLLNDVEVNTKKQKDFLTRAYNDRAKTFEEEMKSYKQDKNYTPEKEAKRRKWFDEDQAKSAQQIRKLDPDAAASINVINQYLQKPAEWLDRHLAHFYSGPYTAMGFTYYFEHLDIFTESKEDYTRSEMVSINPDYFNKALGNDVPQLIMVELVKNSYWYMYKLSNKIKEPGMLAALIGIVNAGREEVRK